MPVSDPAPAAPAPPADRSAKLIEVALPLEEINKAAAKEKSIRHGHPSTLHLWWARRPLAACRAVLFASLVDDPSACPHEFPTEAAQQAERQRLFAIITELVQWENSTNEQVLDAARREIARSVARSTGLPLPDSAPGVQKFLAEHAPPVYDPFCGGGSIPLEAQRLGLRAYGSDLNPVAVLITKALIELPPKFAGRPPVNPRDRAKLGASVSWPGATGLAADVRYYGEWMRTEAQKRIGHLYPKVQLPKEHGGGEATVIAWLWARTVKCPNPACGAQMPLVRSFALSTKKGRETWVQPVVDYAVKTVRFEVRTGTGKPPDPPKVGRGARFRCLVCDQLAPEQHIKAEGAAGRMGAQLLAIVAEGHRGRVYVSPDPSQATIARQARPEWAPEQPLANDPRNIWCIPYGLTTFADLFTPRQLVALTTFSDLVGEARQRVLSDGGEQAYADAVATYLTLAVDRAADYWSSITTWHNGPKMEALRNTFARQAIPMTWDFAEGNPFSVSSGNWLNNVGWVADTITFLSPFAPGVAVQRDATTRLDGVHRPLVSTDPPYYDNIGYADLSDFFYVWLRRSLRSIYPDLFSTMLVPKSQELVATPYRFDNSKERAEQFFREGLGEAFTNIRVAANTEYPLTVYYAFKQAEADGGDAEDAAGIATSTGWETMLEALLHAGLSVAGTWPMRSELGNRMIASGTNALASSIVLVCRPLPGDAPTATRSEFVAALRKELPPALRLLQEGAIAPVDLPQSAIGPGMRIYSRYAKVVDATGERLPVRAALALINQELDAFLTEQEGELDEDSRFCLTWFSQFGHGEGRSGDADNMARARNTTLGRLQESGVLEARGGVTRLRRRAELDPEWDPRSDHHVNDWKRLQQLLVALYYDDPRFGGEAGAARIVQAIGAGQAATARDLAYRLFALCERKGWAEEAGAYNGLVASWPAIQQRAAQSGDVAPTGRLV